MVRAYTGKPCSINKGGGWREEKREEKKEKEKQEKDKKKSLLEDTGPTVK